MVVLISALLVLGSPGLAQVRPPNFRQEAAHIVMASGHKHRPSN
jgi:hypothetical protein